MNLQNQSQSQNQNVAQQASQSQSVFFNDQPRATLDRSKNYQLNKNLTNKHHIRNQPRYTEYEENNHQNQQRFNTNQQHNNRNIDEQDLFYQPDLFKPYTRKEQTRQTRHYPTSYNNNFQSQNSVSRQNYQPFQLRNESPLPYYLQQHERTKTQLTIFSRIPNATLNPCLMCRFSLPSNKPLMVFTVTDPEYSVEDFLNAVTADSKYRTWTSKYTISSKLDT